MPINSEPGLEQVPDSSPESRIPELSLEKTGICIPAD